MIHVRPGAQEDRRVERAAVLHRSLSAIHRRDIAIGEQRPVQVHGHELGNRLDRCAHPAIVQVEGVVEALERGHVDVHPFHRLVRGVVDGVGLAHPRRCAAWPFNDGRAAVDRVLRLAVEDHEHLFAVVVEVLADAGVRLDDAAVHEPQVRVDGAAVEQREVIELAGSIVDSRRRVPTSRIVVRDAVREREARSAPLRERRRASAAASACTSLPAPAAGAPPCAERPSATSATIATIARTILFMSTPFC